MYRIKIGKMKPKYYGTKKQFDKWWQKHQHYASYYTIIGEILVDTTYHEIRKIERREDEK